MDVVVLCETIGVILEKIPSLPTKKADAKLTGTSSGQTIQPDSPGTGGLSISDPQKKDQLKNSLQNFQNALHKEQHNPDYVYRNKLPKWLRNLKNDVNDLTDLVEELTSGASPQQETSAILPFFTSNNNTLKHRQKQFNSKIDQLIKNLNNTIKDDLSKDQLVSQSSNVDKRDLLQGLNNDHLSVAEAAELSKLKFGFYDKLSRHQKLCFAFCSLFPRDHLMDVGRIIRLLAADGGLLLDKNEKEEEILRGSFNALVKKDVFKDVEEDERGVVCKCRMQPTMHDLSRFVADQEENVMVDPAGERVLEGVLRASFDFAVDVSRWIPDSLFTKAKKLRAILFWKTQTLIPNEIKTGSTSNFENTFKSFKASLRLLDLHDLGIMALPTSIGELINLRYLDLSSNKLEKLPSAITKLYNLQTLKLSHCYLLEELPKNIHDLISLRHLELEGCLALTHMPEKIHKLPSLQTLSLYVINEDGGHHLGELSLNTLRGHMEILHLERLNLKLPNNTGQGKVHGLNKHLERVTLRWCHDEDDNENLRDDDTMGSLRPHSDSQLKSLFIVGYKGRDLPNWLSSIQCLVKLSLLDCTGCKFLRQLHQLPKLKFLELLSLDNLEYIEDNVIDNNNKGVCFPSLKELTISDCPKLKSWWKTIPKVNDDNMPYYYFPCLSRLHVRYCPNLTSMPLYPSLNEELVLVHSSIKPLVRTILHGRSFEGEFLGLKSMQIASIEDQWPLSFSSKENPSPQDQEFQCFSSLQKLIIREWKFLGSLPKGFGRLTSLQSLTIENCEKLDLDQAEKEWEGLRNLRSLVLRDNLMLKSLPLGVDKATSLQVLELHNCPEISSLPDSIKNLKSLGRLVISECHKLASLPKGLKEVKSLNMLIILDCSLLLPRCQRDTGDDWPYISHVTNIQLTNTI